MGTYTLRVPASRVGYVPDAQGGLPQGPTYCTYGVRVPASGVGHVPRTVATQVVPTTVLRLERLAFEHILGPLVMSKEMKDAIDAQGRIV